MLSFELCQRLKEKGYPQPDLECGEDEARFAYAYRADSQDLQMFHYDNDERRTVGNDYSNALNDLREEGIELIFCPTIEDLLRALEEDFSNLELSTSGSGWWAWSPKRPACYGDGLWKGAENPETSLANLWLSLH